MTHEKFTEIYKKYWRYAWYVAWKWLGDQHEAEDVAANCFVKLLNEGEVDSPKGFLLVAINNECKNIIKGKSRRKTSSFESEYAEKNEDGFRWTAPDNIGRMEAIEIKSDLLMLMVDELEKRGGRVKEIFLLKYNDEFSYEEIVKKTGLSIDTCRSYIKRAIDYLKDKFKDDLKDYEGRLSPEMARIYTNKRGYQKDWANKKYGKSK